MKRRKGFSIIHFILMALQALASTLDEEELADLRDQFDAIDVDKNGSISLEEMRHVFLFLVLFSVLYNLCAPVSHHTVSCFCTNKYVPIAGPCKRSSLETERFGCSRDTASCTSSKPPALFFFFFFNTSIPQSFA